MPDTHSAAPLQTLLSPVIPANNQQTQYWGQLYGNSLALAIVETAKNAQQPVVVITGSATEAQLLESAIEFYTSDSIPLLHFPDWETLSYDIFSPHQDIISERLNSLSHLPQLQTGIIVLPIQTLAQRIAPQSYISAHSLILDVGDTLSLDNIRVRFEQTGYQCVSSVMEHGEFAVRGSILDVFPMGSQLPFRIELFDDEIENIRSFDPESQRTIEKLDKIHLLPAREFPLDENGIKQFRQAFRVRFEGEPQNCNIYRDISNGLASPGIEYYLPLFFEQTETLFDYIPDNCIVVTDKTMQDQNNVFWQEVSERYEDRCHDIERPILAPNELYIPINEINAQIKSHQHIQYQRFEYESPTAINFNTQQPPSLLIDIKLESPSLHLQSFIKNYKGRTLFSSESTGRRESLLELLHSVDIYPDRFETWQEFLLSDSTHGITVYPLVEGLLISDPDITVITESQLYGKQVLQRRRRKKEQRDSDIIIRNLAELTLNAPVVHEQHGVGRYQGLTNIEVGNIEAEFLMLEYSGGDKLYVPVNSLHLIGRYTGAAPDSAPLHKLGSQQWAKAKRKAAERVRDVAAELLDIYAKREAKQGYSYHIDDAQYNAFSSSFPFEETPDQQTAIDQVITNMRSNNPMDHLVCGDVGFGKTEVAMRAAFIAVQDGKQVAVLCPTTLLTQQHLENFRDRFADWPVKIDSLSRFKTAKETKATLAELAKGTIDIIIGTHKLIQKDIKYKQLGLVVIDEEHRFGVRQKDQFKSLRAEVDIITLTATPIPRTLNMAMSGIRDLSIIASPPAKRLAIKTFVTQWDDNLIKEACLREIKRGGQVFFLHNDVDTIPNQTKKIAELIPEASVEFAHGQMREKQLESTMSDFYHQRFNILVCTTIIETGIDIPTANTIIINRADRLGLAQLYQLRGRVGRSHHGAYAYLITPPEKLLSADAKKRLEAIESIQTLGTGFTLATHDLEIRGAGELLGDEQSGQMSEIGYTMYTELLERAVESLKQGIEPDLDKPLHQGAEIDLHIAALIPDDYLNNIHERLMLYKRISSAKSKDELKELQIEMIDRFGLLVQPIKNLFNITELKLKYTQLGVNRIDINEQGGRIIFDEKPNLDPMKIITLIQTESKIYKLDGNDKLRITKDLENIDKRFKFLDDLYHYLK